MIGGRHKAVVGGGTGGGDGVVGPHEPQIHGHQSATPAPPHTPFTAAIAVTVIVSVIEKVRSQLLCCGVTVRTATSAMLEVTAQQRYMCNKRIKESVMTIDLLFPRQCKYNEHSYTRPHTEPHTHHVGVLQATAAVALLPCYVIHTEPFVQT